jgi:trimeric autotransporter adhesin
MKTKIILFVAFATMMANSSFAQFVISGPATANNLWSGGAIGVGYTAAPTFGTNKFLVNGNSLFTGNSQITGFTGLGTAANVSYRLSVTGNSLFSGNATVGAVPTTGVATSLTVSATGVDDSGLRLATLPNTATVSTTNNGKFLGVDSFGKVILVSAGTPWNLNGNSGTVATSNFIGTTDNIDLVFKRNAIKSGLLATTNTTFGVNSGLALTASSPANTLIGVNSGQAIISGAGNVFLGIDAGKLETNSRVNIFVGASAGQRHTGGTGNTGELDAVTGFPISGNGNTFVGEDTGGTTGTECTYLGIKSGAYANGSNNIYIGAYTGVGITGNNNTFIGSNIAPSVTTVSNSVIIGDGAGNQRIKIDNLGGTTITGLAGTNTGKVLTADATGKLLLVANTGGATIYTADGTLTGTASTRKMTMNGNNLHFDTGTTTSKIYIGTTPTIPATGNYKLYVEGGILTEKVRIALKGTANWADYVFANDYKLAPLNEVEKYYTVNKHLPNVPSSQELLQSGLDLAAMQAKQMEKIEELTLYIVAQNKAIEDLKVKVETLLKK